MEVKKIAILGAGTMGNGIAQVAAMAGYAVSMRDIKTEFIDKGMKNIEANLKKGVEKGKVTEDVMRDSLARIKPTISLSEAVSGADLVIEAIFENIALKKETFKELDEITSPHTIFASNTSALSITEMASATKRPDKVVGMHFFNPVNLMRLVELIRGLETSPETFKAVEAVAKKMGKETVEVNESAGFVTSRMNVVIGNEAFYMLQEGVASAEDIDKALKLGLNHPMGPFEMTDLVGLDVRLNVLNYLYEAFGEKYKPCPLLVKYVKAGRLGRKTGKGVYDYTKKG